MRFLSLAFISALTLVTTGCGGAGSTVMPAMRVAGSGSTSLAQGTARRDTRGVASSTSSTAYPTLVTSTNPIAYYRLNDTNSTMADSGAHGLNGTYGANVKHGGPALTSAAGAGSAIFPGAAAGADIPSNSGTVTTNPLFAAATTSLTVEAWVKPAVANTTNHFVPIVSYGREIQGQAWVIQENPQSGINFWLKTATTSFSVSGSTTLAQGQTYHLVATYDGANAKLYVNGQLQGTVAAPGSLNYSGLNPAWGLGIGGALGSTEPIFNGTISDVAIYHAVLTAAQVQNHYLAGYIAPTPAPTPAPTTAPYTALVAASSPLAYYKLNDTSTTMTDSGPNGLGGVYGANVTHAGAALTSAGDAAANFPGSAAGADIPSNTGTVLANPLFTTPTTNLSVEAWIKPAAYNTTNAYESLVSYGREVIGSAWALQETPQSALTFYLKVNGGSYLLKATTSLLPGQIYHVVATYNGSVLNLYVNGALGSSVAATGTINYTGVRPQDGFSIGGALGGSLPVFNGAINDVAIYPSALSAATVQQHYLVGQIVKPLVETPVSSDRFVDSIGVVTHLRTSGSAYTASFPTFESLIKASGIRHIGDALISTPAFYPAELNQLAADGIHASLITNLSQTAADITATIPAFGSAIEAVEGLNEPDDNGDSNWVADTRSFQQMLYTTVKGNPATASLPVIGPSMVTQADCIALGNLSAYMDAGSIHDYFNGLNPGTTGWGSLSQYGVYGSIPYNVNIGAIVSGTKPIMATETGYGDLASLAGSVDSRTLARYVPRTYLEHFLHGISRTTTYEFYDEPGSGNFANFGIVNADNTPKSSYYAIQSLISTLTDPGTNYTPQSTSYYLTGNLNNVHHLMLQKRNGTYELVIWVEAQGYDPNAKVDLTVPAQTVSLQPAHVPTTASIATIGDTGKLTSSSLSFSNGVASFAIDDHVTIVSFK